MSKNYWLALLVACGATGVSVGCNKTDSTQAPTGAPAGKTSEADGHVHGEWWCDEHGVPEEICAQCSIEVANDLKAKGDWCKEHDRPDSQCFICHPEKETQFAAQYEAKYGKKPPKPKLEGGDEHDHEHEEKKS
ncbi:MAG: RND transporter [Pirellulales bacterium]|nr:RND transporter [Pirellulales bacterium]